MRGKFGGYRDYNARGARNLGRARDKIADRQRKSRENIRYTAFRQENWAQKRTRGRRLQQNSAGDHRKYARRAKYQSRYTSHCSCNTKISDHNFLIDQLLTKYRRSDTMLPHSDKLI